MTSSVTSSVSNGKPPRRFFTITDYQELKEAQKSGKGSAIWWPCAQDLARGKQALDSHPAGPEEETSSDVGTHVTDGSELTSSHHTEVSELPSSASAAAFAAVQEASWEGVKTADVGMVFEVQRLQEENSKLVAEMGKIQMQRLQEENSRLVAEMDKLRKSMGDFDFSEASTDCIGSQVCQEFSDCQEFEDEMYACSHTDVEEDCSPRNSSSTRNTPAGKIKEWLKAHTTKKNDALKDSEQRLSAEARARRVAEAEARRAADKANGIMRTMQGRQARTHPIPVLRARELQRWANSEQFREILTKHGVELVEQTLQTK